YRNEETLEPVPYFQKLVSNALPDLQIRSPAKRNASREGLSFNGERRRFDENGNMPAMLVQPGQTDKLQSTLWVKDLN
ncbi:hypothetical protein Q6249_29700, partial [Klebsiella pneumoniae]|uniref:hypothetical protein n=1 Tax=Klebsiella pneumoniae TaxID=573 RepID=UPI00272FE026